MGQFQNEYLVVPPLSPEWMPKRARDWERLRVGHFPSRPTDKGSEWIVPLCESKPFEFRTSVTNPRLEDGVKRVPWRAQLERMSECDAIVDQVKPRLGNQPFGEWVSIATEAAMLGRIPIANSLRPEAYRATYGEPPALHVCNTEAELSNELDRLCTLTSAQLMEEQAACQTWAERCHGLKPTGELMLRLLG